MSNKKVVSGIEKIVGGFLIEGEGIDEGEVAQEIYNNRKKLGLFTLDDIEIDEKAIIRVMKELYNANPNSGVSFPNIAKAIATKKPIKIKEEWYATQRS